ncbi:hypothetical protein HPB49_020006 [Dermacentor silvarum]|uniref:Uncharacterized protein n=1 Tax=Dermacentor silvarum TaxID=543639 RepID=A0ACB8CZ88_DERSI|nr:hypothetical protein HPB49_020006 [Dermacentor silvarum]
MFEISPQKSKEPQRNEGTARIQRTWSGEAPEKCGSLQPSANAKPTQERNKKIIQGFQGPLMGSAMRFMCLLFSCFSLPPRCRLCKSPGSVALRSRLQIVLEAVRSHDDACLFAVPLDETMCPGYFSTVKEPMDLTMITERVDNGAYTCKEAFIGDFKRMVENCAFYNGLESEIATKGYRLWVAMLDALHTVCFDDDEDGEVDSNRDSDVSSGAGAACSPASRLYVPEHVRKPRPNASDQREDERTMPRTLRASRKTAAQRKSSPTRVQDEAAEGDDDDEDFVAPTVKRRRVGRPPKASRTRGRRRAASNATSRTPSVVKSPALEALSRATRKALEDSADLTYDICRLSGDFEANSDVAGYFPELNIAGTHSHPSDLLARFVGSPEESGGYTIAESPEASSESDSNDRSRHVSGDCSNNTDEPVNATDDGEAGGKQVDSRDDSGSDGNRNPDSNAPAAEVQHLAGDTDTTRSDRSTTEDFDRVLEETTTTASTEFRVSSISNAAECEERVSDVSREGAKGGATQEMAPPNTARPGTMASSSPFMGNRQGAYVQTSVATPPRCRSVPPLHFVAVNMRHAMRVPRSPGSCGRDDSDANATASAEPAEEGRSAASLGIREDRPSLVESREANADHTTAKPDGESESRELNSCRSDGETEVTKDSCSDTLCQVIDGCTDSTASTGHVAAGTDTDAGDKTIEMSSEGNEETILQSVHSEKTTEEQAGASLPAGNLSPERIQVRDRWITRLQGDLQGAEQEFYCGLDSPKSSFSFSSGYLSEEALSPSMRYHSSSSPLPQLSPSRLSPLLPTSCQPPQKESTPPMQAEEAQPSTEREAACDSQPAKEVPPVDAASSRECSVVTDQPQRREPTAQPRSPPFGAPTPLQKMSALVAEIPSPTKRYGAFFPSPFVPPTTSVSATCGGGDQLRDGRDGVAFRPTYVNANHAGGLRPTPSSCITRPVPTQPMGAQRLPFSQEPIAYFIPAAGGHFQPISVQHAARNFSGEGMVGAASVYDWPRSMGIPLQWGCPPIIYYPAELAGHAPQALFLPDLSPEAQRNALSSAPWLRSRRRTPDFSFHHPQQQHRHATALLQSAGHASHVPDGAHGSNAVTATTTSASATQTTSPPEKTRTLAARSTASAMWQHHRDFATHCQVAQPLMVTSAGQLHHLTEAFYQQGR